MVVSGHRVDCDQHVCYGVQLGLAVPTAGEILDPGSSMASPKAPNRISPFLAGIRPAAALPAPIRPAHLEFLLHLAAVGRHLADTGSRQEQLHNVSPESLRPLSLCRQGTQPIDVLWVLRSPFQRMRPSCSAAVSPLRIVVLRQIRFPHRLAHCCTVGPLSEVRLPPLDSCGCAPVDVATVTDDAKSRDVSAYE